MFPLLICHEALMFPQVFLMCKIFYIGLYQVFTAYSNVPVVYVVLTLMALTRIGIGLQIPGGGPLGVYGLDEVKEYPAIALPSTLQVCSSSHI